MSYARETANSVTAQPCLCHTWSETPKTGFLTTRLIYSNVSGSATINATGTGNGAVVHTVVVTDTDPITYAIVSMDPASCPFAINSSKQDTYPYHCHLVNVIVL